MSIDVQSWPPSPYNTQGWQDYWLRFEEEYPGSGRPSRLVSHAVAPFIADVTGDSVNQDILGDIASNYIGQLELYLREHGKSLNLPLGWAESLARGEHSDLMHWLDVWPAVNSEKISDPPQIASWNLSRNALHALPATIIMVATEFLDGEGEIAQFSTGLTVPMSVEPSASGYRVTIRSITTEYPYESQKSWSSVSALGSLEDPESRQAVLYGLVEGLKANYSNIDGQIGKSASVYPTSINLDEFWVVSDVGESFVQEPVVIETVSKARGSIKRFPYATSYRVVNRIEATPLETDDPTVQFEYKLLGTETCSLVTGVDAGEARVLVQTPPASTLPFDPSNPDAEYDWTLRRPTRTDEILDKYRETVRIAPGATKVLESNGFRVRLCPDFVPEDKEQTGGPDGTKIIQLPADQKLPVRRNDFSALSAYYNCKEFFELLAHFGIHPATFVVRAEPELQVFYRYGITPGPGKDGRTINAQVAFDCKAAGHSKPPIRMNLALAELSRWDRPKNSEGVRTWAQPLGIATDKRWILHEFGHYLLAARIGQLEFDFAHSSGDAMAAIACDPESRLADARDGVAESFRGVTYPFVFSTRRHDRSPTLGWAWYGELNRSVIEAPPSTCDQLKGYLTEQILSSTLFRLYRALGGDSTVADAPDLYLRQRASFLTLYLLIRAIYAIGQSPSKAEMLELGMEQVGLLQGGVLEMAPLQQAPDCTPLPDGWKGGLTHKVVRWAFETQGMFVEHPEETHNGMGRPPPVDIYIEDQRPLSEMVNGSRFTYGPGSYCPVSLDWGDAALWQMPNQVIFGNRGSETAQQCHLRKWFGFVFNPNEDWGLTSKIFWSQNFKEDPVPDIPAGAPLKFQSENTEAAIAERQQQAKAQAPKNAAGFVLVLYELTCPDDRANTDPLQHLAVAVGADSDDLPRTPRALTDLVANDNNLGLQVIRFQ